MKKELAFGSGSSKMMANLFPPEAPTLMIEITLYVPFGSENFKKARTLQGIIHLRSGAVIARSNRVSRR
jgi:hypothetical protein